MTPHDAITTPLHAHLRALHGLFGVCSAVRAHPQLSLKGNPHILVRTIPGCEPSCTTADTNIVANTHPQMTNHERLALQASWTTLTKAMTEHTQEAVRSASVLVKAIAAGPGPAVTGYHPALESEIDKHGSWSTLTFCHPKGVASAGGRLHTIEDRAAIEHLAVAAAIHTGLGSGTTWRIMYDHHATFTDITAPTPEEALAWAALLHDNRIASQNANPTTPFAHVYKTLPDTVDTLLRTARARFTRTI